MEDIDHEDVERVSHAFHATYEDYAPHFGWDTQERSRTSWHDLPDTNRRLMIATVKSLLDRGIIRLPAEPPQRPQEAPDAPET